MARTKLEHLTCDRCGHSETIGAVGADKGKRGDWAQLRAETLDGKTIIANPSDEALPADFCQECTGGFVNWLMEPKLAPLREAAGG